MATERPAKAKRILVVEDELMIRMLLEGHAWRPRLRHRCRSRAHRRGVGSDEEGRLRPCDPRRQSQRPARLAGRRCPRRPRHTILLCHGLWRVARALSRPADAEKAVPQGWA